MHIINSRNEESNERNEPENNATYPSYQDLEKLKKEIMFLEIKAKNKLGIDELKKIDFYDLRGLKILSTFVVFVNSNDRDRILNQFKQVFNIYISLRVREIFIIHFELDFQNIIMLTSIYSQDE